MFQFILPIHTHLYLTYVWIPLCFILFMSTLLVVAVYRVWTILREERITTLNEKYMALHSSLLFILGVSLAANDISYFGNGE